MIKAIIFDADGVILDSEILWDEGQVEFLARRGLVYSASRTKHMLTGRTLTEGAAIMQKQYGFPGDPEVLGLERYEIMKKFYPQVKFMGGFLEFFGKIKNSYKLAVATSCKPELFMLADKNLKISEMFKHQIYFLRDVNNVSKPKPDIYLFAAKQLGVEPNECLVIEDAPNGIKAAHRAGMKVVALSTSHGRELVKDADQVVDSFEQINLSKY